MRREAPQNANGLAARQCLAYHVKRLRLERGWSQLQLAGAAGLHRTHLSRLENSVYNASIDTLVNIAAAFGVRSSSLLEPPAPDLGAALESAHAGQDRKRHCGAQAGG